MSYFNVFFQAAVCHSWFSAAKLRLKKQSYGNNCDRRILKKHKKSVGELFMLWGYDSALKISFYSCYARKSEEKLWCLKIKS